MNSVVNAGVVMEDGAHLWARALSHFHPLNPKVENITAPCKAHRVTWPSPEFSPHPEQEPVLGESILAAILGELSPHTQHPF